MFYLFIGIRIIVEADATVICNLGQIFIIKFFQTYVMRCPADRKKKMLNFFSSTQLQKLPITYATQSMALIIRLCTVCRPFVYYMIKETTNVC